MKTNIGLTDLLLSNFQLYQDEREFKFSIDAVLLSHFGEAKGHKRYLDMGTGTGVIPHILYHRGARHVVGVDINPHLVELARKSVHHNGIEEAVQIDGFDYMSDESKQYYGQFDGIYINPPYFAPQSGHTSVHEGRSMALHEQHYSILEILNQCKKFLTFGGFLWMIHRVERLEEILSSCEQARFAVKRMRFIHGHVKKEAKLVLLEMRLGGKRGMRIDPPLMIYESDGTYTSEVQSYYG